MARQQTYSMSEFIHDTTYEKIPGDVITQLKKHLLDSAGSMLHAVGRPTIQKMVNQIKTLGAEGSCYTPALDHIPADRAAQLYTALIRYPDFMDNYLGKEATCHPSDNIGSLLAACQLTGCSGREFLTAMAIGYEIECRLVEEIPVMIKGFDHTVLLGYSLTAALSKIFSLTEEQTAHALGIAGCSINPLVTCRASYTYEWKGLASSLVALECMNIVLLAKNGLTGPLSLFEGPKGFKDVFGMSLEYDWGKEDFCLIRKCILKEFNAEVHTQSILEAVLDLREAHYIPPTQIESIDVKTFLTCFHIVGGGEYGSRKNVHSKEQADHSLPYVIAALLLDGEVYPRQFMPERIEKSDVQDLLKKVTIHTSSHLHKPKLLAGILDPYTEAYPDKLSAEVEIKLYDGQTFTCKKEDYHGFHTRPFSWEDTERKFLKLTDGTLGKEKQQNIINAIARLEELEMKEVVSILGRGE